jgi:hypothetical protein
MMISCPACAMPKSNAPHPQNNEHTLSRPADIAYTTRRKKKKEVSERIARERKTEKQKIRTKLREKKRPLSVVSLSVFARASIRRGERNNAS